MQSHHTRSNEHPNSCSAKTKDEVIANFRKYWNESQHRKSQSETKQQRMERKADEFADSELRRNNYQTSFYPVFQICGPLPPIQYKDDRLNDYIGKYGAVRSD